MPELPSPTRARLEAELHAVRAELARVQAAHHQQTQDQAATARYHLSQLRFRTVFEHSPLGHKIIDANLTIRQANAAVAALLGLESPLELLGHAILEFAHPDYVADWTRLQAALWAHHIPAFTLETCLLRPDGEVRWCRVTSVLFPDEGAELGYTTLEDITDRKQLEAQVQQRTHQVHDANEQLAAFNEELQVVNEELLEANGSLSRVNAELDMFVYAASHDLRTPVSNLQGLVQALAKELPTLAQRPGQVQPILNLMKGSLTRFGHTLDRLADFSMVRTTDGLAREHVDLATVLAEVRLEVGPLLAASHGQLVADFEGAPSLWLAAKHVHSVLLNLVSNALKFRQADRPPVVHVRSYRELGHIVVRVQDNGVGLSEAQQRRLFRLFERLHPEVAGTGVGLFLVKKIMANVGGSIQVESEQGQGATFTAVFPG